MLPQGGGEGARICLDGDIALPWERFGTSFWAACRALLPGVWDGPGGPKFGFGLGPKWRTGGSVLRSNFDPQNRSKNDPEKRAPLHFHILSQKCGRILVPKKRVVF